MLSQPVSYALAGAAVAMRPSFLTSTWTSSSGRARSERRRLQGQGGRAWPHPIRRGRPRRSIERRSRAACDSGLGCAAVSQGGYATCDAVLECAAARAGVEVQSTEQSMLPEGPVAVDARDAAQALRLTSTCSTSRTDFDQVHSLFDIRAGYRGGGACRARAAASRVKAPRCPSSRIPQWLEHLSASKGARTEVNGSSQQLSPSPASVRPGDGLCENLRSMSSRAQGAQGPRRRLSAEERRESILDAANHVFGEHGFENVRIDDVATAAGISKALIYEHFGSKQELYGELMSRAAMDLVGRARAGGLRARHGGRSANGERGRRRLPVGAGAPARVPHVHPRRHRSRDLGAAGGTAARLGDRDGGRDGDGPARDPGGSRRDDRPSSSPR